MLCLNQDYEDIRLFKQEANKGQSAARNRGIREANGDYIMFCDSDDFLDEESLPMLYKTCVENELDILYTGWKTLKKGRIEYNIPPEGLMCACEPLSAEEYFLRTIHDWYNVVPWNGMYRREFLLKNELFFPEGIQFEDNMFHLESLLTDPSAQVMQLESCFYNVNHRDDSTTSARPGAKKIYDQMENIRLMNEFIGRIEIYRLQEAAKAAVSSLVFTMTSYYYRLNTEDRRQIRRSIPREVLTDAIRHPQTKFQKTKLIMFTYYRPLLDVYEFLRCIFKNIMYEI